MSKKIIALALLVAVVGGMLLWRSDRGYTVQIVMPSATNLVNGSPVKIDGFNAGKVQDLQVRDGKAVVTVSVDSQYAPLRDGTTAQISWKALLGERVLDINPGPSNRQALPDGAIIQSSTDRVEIDQVLAALDKPTRAKLDTLIKRLDATTNGDASDINRTLAAGGPALQALGDILSAVGEDGPAIRMLVTRLNGLASVMARHQNDITTALHGLTAGVTSVASRQSALRTALHELPRTLDQADTTLGKVPATVDAAHPLLQDLQPAAAQLPGVARQLSPVMTDLRPVVANLRPTLAALSPLLQVTPALLDSGSSVLPQTTQALGSTVPALDFLRPYTPELTGWLSNWGSAAGNYDSNGHYLRAFFQQGLTSLNANPGILPPDVTNEHDRLPGQNENQPWTDANGSTLR